MAGVDDAFDHHLDLAAAFFLTEEPCPDHSRIVEDQQIPRGNELRQIGKLPVMQRFAVHVQQPAGRAFIGWVLGNQLGRQIEIEVVESEHAGNSLRVGRGYACQANCT